MFFILSKLLIVFTKPFLVLVILLILSFLVKNKTWRKRIRVVVLVFFILTANGILIGEAMRLWEIPPVKMEELENGFQYGIVLGGGADVERPPFDRLFLQKSGERITQAVQLYKAGKIEKILYTGGRSEVFEDAEVNVSPVIDFFLDCGVPREDIVVENKSRNTYENAVYSALLVDKSKKHLLITSAFHMRRSVGCFEKAGVVVEPFSCDFYSPKEEDRFSVRMLIPSAGSMEAWEVLIKEWLGIIAYSMAGYL